MKIKKGVVYLPEPEMYKAQVIIGGVFKSHGKKLVITSGREGNHGDNSLHPFGYAFDCRIRFWTKKKREKVAREIQELLPFPYDLVVKHKPPHYHCEYDVTKTNPWFKL